MQMQHGQHAVLYFIDSQYPLKTLEADESTPE